MKLIRGLHNRLRQYPGCVAAIGNFDGVHLGHQQIIRQVQALAEKYTVPSCLISFEPYPREFFSDVPVARLMRLREKIKVLEHHGLAQLIILPFNAKLANCSAESFIDDILITQLNVKAIVVGADFRFGHHRQGDVAMLAEYAHMRGFELQQAKTVDYQNERISSTRIRQALMRGELEAAEQMLGRRYVMQGRVAHGDKRGREWGFPTANIHLHRKLSAVRGVYIVRIHGIDDQIYNGVANVGNRPTVEGSRTLLEVNIFDFSTEIYGRAITVEFIEKIRDEQRFTSFEVLKQQVEQDRIIAKRYFEKLNEGS